MQIQTTTYPVEVLTGYYQISGEFSPRGRPPIYVNDQQVASFSIDNASVLPLAVGARIGEMPYAPAYVPKEEVQLMILGDFTAQEASLKPNAIRMRCFTDTYAIRATFYVGAETKPPDIFAVGGPFFGITDVEIFAIRPLAVDIAGEADIAYINASAVRLFYKIE